MVRCTCKAQHSLLDLVPAIAGRKPADFKALLSDMTVRFWNEKAVDSMIRYWKATGQPCPQNFSEVFPDWICERIDLVHSGAFRPVWLVNRWILIEFDPIANEDRWRISNADRLCYSSALWKYEEQTRRRLGLKPAQLMLPDSPTVWRQASDIREWLSADENYVPQDGIGYWSGGQHWLEMDGCFRYNTSNNITYAVPFTRSDDQALYEFFVQE